MDVATGQAKIVGNDPWMVPQRTLAPSWSPDSKWVAFASRLNTLYRAIVVANVETGEKKQVTDGLADAMYPVWDASGKYLWFLASTDFGLALAVARHDVVRPRGDVRAVSRRAEEGASRARCCPRATRTRASARAPAENTQQAAPGPAPPRHGADRFRRPAAAHPAGAGVPSRQYAQLKAGAAGTVFFLEAPARRRRARQHAASLPAERSQGRAVLRPTSREYAVSADGKKLVYRTPRRRGRPATPAADAGAAGAVPRRRRQGRADGRRRAAST